MGITIEAYTIVEPLDDDAGRRRPSGASRLLIGAGATVARRTAGAARSGSRSSTTPIGRPASERLTSGSGWGLRPSTSTCPGLSFARLDNYNLGQILLILLGVVGGLFLIIQAVAFVMGLSLARSITGSVHELFDGTERVAARRLRPQDRHPLARSARRAGRDRSTR